MTRFLNGPAAGTRDLVGLITWDALDQPTDTPAPEESVFAYKVKGEPTMCHLNIRGGKGGFYPLAEYELCEVQPTEEEMRSTAAWRAWCERNRP